MSGIVLTTDLSPESQRAFAPVRALAEKLDLPIMLLAVLEDIPCEPIAGNMMGVYPDREKLHGDWVAKLKELSAKLGDACKDAVVVEAADVSRAIVDFSRDREADYIAMATHGRAGLRRWVMGSTAEVVVRHATVPVLLYPPSE